VFLPDQGYFKHKTATFRPLLYVKIKLQLQVCLSMIRLSSQSLVVTIYMSI